MTALADHELLAEYVRTQSEPAFATLVDRHVNLVFSTARRLTGNAHSAEEITQVVFLILARKAGSLRAGQVLPGWLYHTTRLTAANYVKGEIRRERREQEVYMQSATTTTEPAWAEIAPLLDEAMGRLGPADRNAVVMRFFERKTATEVAAALHTTEAAAHKRLQRALEKLRRFFTRRGVTLTAAVLAGAVSTHAVSAAPVELAAAAAAGAIPGHTLSTTITLLAKTTMKTMTWMKLKIAAGLGLAVVLTGGIATTVVSGEFSGTNANASASVFQIRKVLNPAASGAEDLTLVTTNAATGQVHRETLHVEKKVLLDQTAVAMADVAPSLFQQGTGASGRQYEVTFTLTPEGKERLAQVTRENINHRLAIIVAGKVVTAPTVKSEISGGRAQITGNFTEAEATRIAVLISKPSGK